MARALYLHFPFCRRRCIYCDFNTYASSDLSLRTLYKDAMLKDLSLSAGNFTENEPLTSVFFGGGTPTLASPLWISQIMQCIKSSFNCAKDMEVTIEANPGTVTQESLTMLRNAGVNRISFGVQSLDPDLLHTLGRIHTASQAIDSINFAKQCGFDNINVDLILGLPSQTEKIFSQTLSELLTLNITHLACYALSVEEGTVLSKGLDSGLYSLPEDRELDKMEKALLSQLKKAGFHHYEISNWCLPGNQCRHNLVYWHNNEYLGVGAGSASFVNGWRYTRIKNPGEYIKAVDNQQSPIVSCERLSQDNRLKENIMLALRLHKGFNINKISQANPLIKRRIKQFLTQFPDVFFRTKGPNVALTARGRDISNEIFQRLFESVFIYD